MDKVRKVVFDPLATTKAQVRRILSSHPVGTAHPFSADKILLCKTKDDGIDEVDISAFPEDFFYNAVDLGEMGEVLLKRMAGFPQLADFSDYQILQAPASTFSVPIAENSRPTILAVSERNPTYYDLCLADPTSNRTACYSARNTFQGVVHSGDINHGSSLLHTISFMAADRDQRARAAPLRQERDSELCVFISGYQYTKITRFLGTHPALLVADHEAKMLYLIPVPLDSATIGDATLCCPLVVKQRSNNTLVCSILQKATTDTGKMCSSAILDSPCCAEARERACFDPPMLRPAAGSDGGNENGNDTLRGDGHGNEETSNPAHDDNISRTILSRRLAVIATTGTNIPRLLLSDSTQVVRFGTGLEFELATYQSTPSSSSGVVLPLILGTPLEGPVLLATGTLPVNTRPPFSNSTALRKYYTVLDRVVVVIDERMTDNARNLSGSLRMNAMFIVKSSATAKVVGGQKVPRNADEIVEVLNETNINAVTALAGPQSLVLVHFSERYYFYRGLGNGTKKLDTTSWSFGDDVTDVIEPLFSSSHTAQKSITSSPAAVEDVAPRCCALTHPLASRIVDISQPDKLAVILPRLNRTVLISELEGFLAKASIDDIHGMQDDVASAVHQLQLLLSQKKIQALSAALVAALSSKITDVVEPLRKEYLAFIKTKPDDELSDSASAKEWKQNKATMLGRLRKETLDRQRVLGPVVTSFTNMVSAQATSKRTHDLKRLLRQSQIQGNVNADEGMTFETLAEYLETRASDMGVMLVNIEADAYRELLGKLRAGTPVDASTSCNLDSRLLHLDGFDAGILIEQSQDNHHGPLRRLSSTGTKSARPTMALPLMAKEYGEHGSMLAWACWDEFVNLDSPYTTRWLDKCNEPHIAAVRIITRETLSEAMISREHNYASSSSEIGFLMSALLMSSMAKLSAMRTTAPTVVHKAEDTVTRLMRGLFGNLLTIAGSGLKPMSMVWQLCGLDPQYDVPNNDAEWMWYETVTALYPYTGWPLRQFQRNLEKLLDKVIVRVVTKNEDVSGFKQNRLDEMANNCKLRNAQLAHSRTIIEIFMRHVVSSTARDGEKRSTDSLATISRRLLERVPENLRRQTDSYGRMIAYLHHLADGGARMNHGDMVFAGVYSKRSAVFGTLKLDIAQACRNKDWQRARHATEALMNQHAEIAAVWRLDAENMPMQNRQAYKDLLAGTNGQTQPSADIYKRVVSDAERQRTPWQIGKKGQFGDSIPPVDEAFVHEMLTGKKTDIAPANKNTSPCNGEVSSAKTLERKSRTVEEEFAELESAMVPAFLETMQKTLTAEDVCKMLAVPVSSMRVFANALNPAFAWEDMPLNFKKVMLGLVRDRSNRAESKPASRLMGMRQSKQGSLES